MKRRKQPEQKNMGFSLVEVLVAMLIIALVSVPLIRTFIVTANVNHKSRRIQNATTVAQAVSEYFEAMSLASLKATYGEPIELADGTLVYKNIGDGINTAAGIPYYKGEEGEKFYVTVVLDPTDFSTNDGTDNGISDVNNYVAPSINNLAAAGSVTIFKQFSKYDSTVVNKLKSIYNSELGNTEITKDELIKSSVITINETQNGEKVDYTYNMNVTYTYTKDASKAVTYDFTIEDGSIESFTGYAPNLYLVYGAFDMYGSSYSPYARDTIDIEYMTDEVRETEWEKPVNVYFIQQKVYYGNNVNNAVSVLPENVHINCYNDSAVSGKNFENGEYKLSMYSNVEGWSSDAEITTGTDNMTKLYTMNVYIRYDESDTTNYEIGEGTITLSDFFTSVTTVKEE